MTAGVPVVAADRGSLPEVLGGAGVLVNPDDAADVAEGIRRVYTDEGFAAACTAHGLARAGHFRWSETAARAYDAYGRALERRRSKGHV